MNFPIQAIRSQFPALNESRGTIFFDNAAGAQLPARVIDAVTDHLVHRMVQRGGPYALSREVDDVIERARAAVADLVNAPDPNVRQNRLALLHAILSEFSTIADFSEIVTEGKSSN